jgi:hypothetical protein
VTEGATLTALGVSAAFRFGPKVAVWNNAQVHQITGFHKKPYGCGILNSDEPLPFVLGQMMIRVTTPAAAPVRFTILFQSEGINVAFNYVGHNLCPTDQDEITVSASMHHPALITAWWST